MSSRAKRPTILDKMKAVARRPPPVHQDDEHDCEICRMLTAQGGPVEVMELPDGSTLELRQMPDGMVATTTWNRGRR